MALVLTSEAFYYVTGGSFRSGFGFLSQRANTKIAMKSMATTTIDMTAREGSLKESYQASFSGYYRSVELV